MSVSDYPDFLRVEQWVGAPFLAGVHAGVANNTSFGPFFVAPWECVSLLVNVAASSPASIFTVEVAFSDPAFVPFVGLTTWHCTAGQLLIDMLPVHGSMMTITIRDLPAARDMSMFVIPRRGYSPMARWPNGDPLLRVIGAAVGAGATTSLVLGVCTSARCTFTIQTTAVAWIASLTEIDQAGVSLSRVGTITSTDVGLGGSIQVDLPPNPIRWGFSNLDGVGRTVDSALVPLRT